MTVVLLLVVYARVIISCFKLRGQDESDQTFRANSALLVVGLVGNLAAPLLRRQHRPGLAALVCRPDRRSAACCSSSSSSSAAGPAAGRRPGRPRATSPAKEPEPCTSSSPRTGASSPCAAARQLKSFADPAKIEEISVIAVVRPLAAVAFADELSPASAARPTWSRAGSARRPSRRVATVAARVRRLGAQGAQEGALRVARPTRSSRRPRSSTPAWSWWPPAAAGSATRCWSAARRSGSSTTRPARCSSSGRPAAYEEVTRSPAR